jgi:hypothetical protein
MQVIVAIIWSIHSSLKESKNLNKLTPSGKRMKKEPQRQMVWRSASAAATDHGHLNRKHRMYKG